MDRIHPPTSLAHLYETSNPYLATFLLRCEAQLVSFTQISAASLTQAALLKRAEWQGGEMTLREVHVL